MRYVAIALASLLFVGLPPFASAQPQGEKSEAPRAEAAVDSRAAADDKRSGRQNQAQEASASTTKPSPDAEQDTHAPEATKNG
ncbi:MAG: hypothetical protein A4S17_11450 [Proteobacteria bacterium HN_bin10]|nr:MAG: hypothetical protein A4S17_11450 [Proteobacteria bacterium HN_bin10]